MYLLVMCVFFFLWNIKNNLAYISVISLDTPYHLMVFKFHKWPLTSTLLKWIPNAKRTVPKHIANFPSTPYNIFPKHRERTHLKIGIGHKGSCEPMPPAEYATVYFTVYFALFIRRVFYLLTNLLSLISIFLFIY